MIKKLNGEPEGEKGGKGDIRTTAACGQVNRRHGRVTRQQQNNVHEDMGTCEKWRTYCLAVEQNCF